MHLSNDAFRLTEKATVPIGYHDDGTRCGAHLPGLKGVFHVGRSGTKWDDLGVFQFLFTGVLGRGVSAPGRGRKREMSRAAGRSTGT